MTGYLFRKIALSFAVLVIAWGGAAHADGGVSPVAPAQAREVLERTLAEQLALFPTLEEIAAFTDAAVLQAYVERAQHAASAARNGRGPVPPFCCSMPLWPLHTTGGAICDYCPIKEAYERGSKGTELAKRVKAASLRMVQLREEARRAGQPIDVNQKKPLVAVIGAGPAGVAAARALTSRGVEVVVFNDRREFGGGVIENYLHRKILRKTWRLDDYSEILSRDGIDYAGGVRVGAGGNIEPDDLAQLGFSGVVMAIGATKDKRLGIPGEDHAIYASAPAKFYNQVWTGETHARPKIGERVAIIGAGKSAADEARWILDEHPHVKEVYLIIRRSPVDGLNRLGNNYFGVFYHWLQKDDFEAEVTRHGQALWESAIDPQEYIRRWYDIGDKEIEPGGVSLIGKESPKVKIRFLSSPREIHVEDGAVTGLTLERNTPERRADGSFALRETGETYRIPVDTVLSVVGFEVDPKGWDLPVKNGSLRVRADRISQPRPVDSYRLDVEREIPYYALGWALGSQGTDHQIEGAADAFANQVAEELRNGNRTYSPEDREKLRRGIYERAKQGRAADQIALRFPGIAPSNPTCERIVSQMVDRAAVQLEAVEKALRE